jgi:hypothetical protein
VLCALHQERDTKTGFKTARVEAVLVFGKGRCEPVHRSQPCRVDGTLLIPRAVTFFASVTSKALQESVLDAGRNIVRSLLESAPDDLELPQSDFRVICAKHCSPPACVF